MDGAMSRAAILCIGTELTRGEIVNTNASWLAESLTDLGFEVTAIDVVDDDRERIRAALSKLGAEHAVLVCTGGLGPTTDDITSECVAALLGVPLDRDSASLEAIRERMERFGRTLAGSNLKQADFPRGASVIPNRRGTAPGFSIRIERALSFFLPGVPHEMKQMFASHVAPAATPLVSGAIHQIRIKTFGMTESGVNDKLEGIEATHQVVLAYRAHFPEIEVKVLARAEAIGDAEARSRAAADEVKTRLGHDVVYGEGNVAFAAAIGELLTERGWMLAAAESCTGGMVSELVTENSGSSAYFSGALVTYADSAKTALLGVPQALIAEHGAVSEPVARAMAEGARRCLGVEIALAITGIAGPTGGSPDKPVGLVHFAVATDEGCAHRQIIFPGTRSQVRRLAAFAALALVRKVLIHGMDE
jgi:nicotinamide-nucleotide amidase